ncbi:zinc-binding dehydrogenase [Komagataeibacter xylinus]|uniref:zinc-binding dehydrogenase n=1 Tax=Komagataeibacter xylinus TaxID=28448 RepID=UPI00280A6F4A|nr:zinc-binding dehydrogenase [Komagataeibacter xylinus]
MEEVAYARRRNAMPRAQSTLRLFQKSALAITVNNLVEQRNIRATSGHKLRTRHGGKDGMGPVSWKASLDALRRSGTLCWFCPVEITSIPNSVKIGYAVFRNHVPTPDLLHAHSAQLFNWIIEGRLKVHIGGTYPLADAPHAGMESCKTTGKFLLIP